MRNKIILEIFFSWKCQVEYSIHNPKQPKLYLFTKTNHVDMGRYFKKLHISFQHG